MPATRNFSSRCRPRAASDHAEEFENIIVRSNPDGSVVRVRDVARVELGAQSSDTTGRLNGRPAANIGIFQAPGGERGGDRGSSCATRWRPSSERFPEGVDYKITYDTTVFVKDTIKEVDPHAARGVRPRRARGFPLPRQHPRHAHPA